jgi:hypothetical protein
MVAEKHGNDMAVAVCWVGAALQWVLFLSVMTICDLPPAATDITGKYNRVTACDLRVTLFVQLHSYEIKTRFLKLMFFRLFAFKNSRNKNHK